MCGIVGCVGHEGAVPFAVQGLETLEYRGYDSAGVAFEPLQGDNSGRIEVVKTLGGVAALQQRLDTLVDTEATTAIGPNRYFGGHGPAARCHVCG
jgi:glucosamine--fructose-6-phosphate aminotransferase (isomerizing)